MGLTEALAVAAVCLMGAMSPGPSLAVVIKNTLGGGRRQGLVCAWSHAAGIGVYAVATVFGFAVLLTLYPDFARVVTLAGAAYLLWLGVQALRAGRSSAGGQQASGGSDSLAGPLRDGFAMALLNPKIAMFFIALFSQFVEAGGPALASWTMAGIAVVIDGAWYSLVAVMLAQPTVLAGFQRQMHWVHRVSGVLFVAIALRIVFI